ncbi:TrgA family protein [Rhodovulum strictum]|uniref:TrgA family protein n=1 Tax=Rhodovulum strictum TaxID=58314 RepID=A0A844B729_9RHOB|nr:TrgA family protein [Rhodovulum strictum]MRH22186.1 TrgA family protein [Rhodovulum strictum]
MPTAAKLVAALLFAAVAWFTSDALVPVFPEGTNLGKFTYVNTAIGLLAGWLVMGRLAGEGYGVAVASGVRTSAVLAFYALLAHSIYEMLRMATRLRFDGIMDALTGTVELMARNGLMLVTAPVAMGILVGGGILAAIVVEFIAHRWN